MAERLGREVLLDRAGQREGDHQRRAHQEVGLDVLVHARFEVAVAREHAGGDDVVAGDRRLDARVERAGVADAGRAAVADEVEAQLVEIRLQAGLVEVVADHARARAPATS